MAKIDPSDDDLSDYWIAFGMFMHAFAEIEADLRELLRRVTGTSRRSAKVIFSGVRVDQAKGFIIRQFEIKNEQMPLYLDRALKQLGEITLFRNDLVHFGTSLSRAGDLVITNKEIAISNKRIRTIGASPIVLKFAKTDLAVIGFCLAFQAKYYGCNLSSTDATLIDRFGVDPAWLYKQRLPSHWTNKHPRKLPK